MTSDEFELVRVASTVALGGFLVGFDATVISGAVPFSRDYFGLGGPTGRLKLGWAVSCLGWGAMAGNLAAGRLSDRFGRRSVLLLTAVLFLASSFSAALSTRFAVFVAARICGGLAARAARLTAPVYIAHTPPSPTPPTPVPLHLLIIPTSTPTSLFPH